MPRICIGLPVFNGERFIAHSIDSILAQTYDAFQLIILDNASTDRTEEICTDYARRDSRVSYRRNVKNIGAPENFNKVFTLAESEYFKWAAADDLLEPEYLARCIDILDQDRGTVLCHTRVKIVDHEGKELGEYVNPMARLDSANPVDRFSDMVLCKHKCFDVFGVIRSEALAHTRQIGSYMSADRNLLAELSLMGKIRIAPDPLFLSREHGDRSVRIKTREELREWWGQSGTFVFSYWRLAAEYFATVNRAQIPWHVKALCRLVLFNWGIRHWRYLGSDIAVFGRRILTSSRQRADRFE